MSCRPGRRLKDCEPNPLQRVAYNRQPWDFIVVTDRGMIEQFKIAAQRMEKAGAIIAVVLDPATKYWREGHTLPPESQFKALLGVPDDRRLLTLVSISAS
ncbi:MAG: nitroreductase family protein, partial [Anaerolineae bacterium]|nr:nitroreductase family protein [Anaerolineae bacterium]